MQRSGALELTFVVTQAIPPPPAQAQLRADATYAVVGGFGGVGKAIVSWLADHGARNIVALSRSGGRDPQSAAFIRDMQARGVRVVGRACDITSREQLANLARDMGQDGLPPVRGIVQSAMVLRVSPYTSLLALHLNLFLPVFSLHYRLAT